ncbi:hypothetical protein IF2G_11006 [Cordyceps javanica]|nr:hypothetical protein IF2G_11006 [Cordyceps javanica]
MYFVHRGPGYFGAAVVGGRPMWLRRVYEMHAAAPVVPLLCPFYAPTLPLLCSELNPCSPAPRVLPYPCFDVPALYFLSCTVMLPV